MKFFANNFRIDVSRRLLMTILTCYSLALFCGQSQAAECEPAGPFGLPGLVGPADQIGQWSPVLDWPDNATHATVLGSGKVLWWRTGEPTLPHIYDPLTNTNVATPPVDLNLLCAGHATMANGNTIVVGGMIDFIDDYGSEESNIYDTITGTWSSVAPTTDGRWYGTTTALPDGRISVIGGTITPFPFLTWADTPEIYDPDTNVWTPIPSANRYVDKYPYIFVLPDGRLLNAGPLPTTQALNLATGLWELVDAGRHAGIQGTAAMYRPGKVLRLGGDDPATNEADVLDMTVASPAWVDIDPMEYARRRPDVVLLPDGDAVVIGGSVASQADPECAVHAAELWDADTQVWTTLASMQRPRIYHSTAILLPDGRVLAAGGENQWIPSGGEKTAEIFSPPYLFKGPRPIINSAPATLGYGTQFDLEVDDRDAITSIVVMRPGSVTHNFDQNQRYVPLNYVNGTDPNVVQVTSPVSVNIAPPGTYMLFVVSALGVPSVASFVSINPVVDTDVDGVSDTLDNCVLNANASQLDSNDDGIGNACDADIDNNCIVNFLDYGFFPAAFSSIAGDPNYDADIDFDGNGVINFLDATLFQSSIFGPPGPSANPCIPPVRKSAGQ